MKDRTPRLLHNRSEDKLGPRTLKTVTNAQRCILLANQHLYKYQPSGEGGTRSPPATPQNPKWPPGGPKMANGSEKVSTPRFLGVLRNFR